MLFEFNNIFLAKTSVRLRDWGSRCVSASRQNTSFGPRDGWGA